MTLIYCPNHRRSFLDSCDLCENEQPTYERTLLLHLDVPSAWLDPDSIGDPTNLEVAWTEFRNDIAIAVRRLFQNHVTHKTGIGDPVPVLVDTEWNAEPEVKKG